MASPPQTLLKSPQSVSFSNRFSTLGFVYRRMRRKPVLTDNHRNSRIQWCMAHKEDHFDKDIFIGKTALKPFLASLNQLKGVPPDPNQPRQQTTLHLWGAISRKGASPLQVT